ncbi:hypothetical protein TRFO_31404 [Tritrichomonas foetus]|uniref:Myb-like DNA-binding domain containing protein n=1 Tax=Tritrichomonas foetus TaxID=1144522 RepID=A0A1J4JVZ8_9EUKA|nr:hypothetical protein TRFO_31404 [Tritrichomonas foetus]|eukprot:OHT01702.1 hypothetical protein TRFO_31404 [Tritrichomonas foetus]
MNQIIQSKSPNSDKFRQKKKKMDRDQRNIRPVIDYIMNIFPEPFCQPGCPLAVPVSALLYRYIKGDIGYADAYYTIFSITGVAFPVEKLFTIMNISPQPLPSTNLDQITSSISNNNNSNSMNNLNVNNNLTNSDANNEGNPHPKIESISPKNKRKKCKIWSKIEDERLLAAILKYGLDNWSMISRFIGNNRTRSQCCQRWTRGLDPRISKNQWTYAEDKLLMSLVESHGQKTWTQIAAALGNRSDVQCRYHYQQLLKENSIHSKINKGNINKAQSLDMLPNRNLEINNGISQSKTLGALPEHLHPPPPPPSFKEANPDSTYNNYQNFRNNNFGNNSFLNNNNFTNEFSSDFAENYTNEYNKHSNNSINSNTQGFQTASTNLSNNNFNKNSNSNFNENIQNNINNNFNNNIGMNFNVNNQMNNYMNNNVNYNMNNNMNMGVSMNNSMNNRVGKNVNFSNSHGEFPAFQPNMSSTPNYQQPSQSQFQSYFPSQTESFSIPSFDDMNIGIPPKFESLPENHSNKPMNACISSHTSLTDVIMNANLSNFNQPQKDEHVTTSENTMDENQSKFINSNDNLNSNLNENEHVNGTEGGNFDLNNDKVFESPTKMEFGSGLFSGADDLISDIPDDWFMDRTKEE